jgi:hypothetical protein
MFLRDPAVDLQKLLNGSRSGVSEPCASLDMYGMTLSIMLGNALATASVHAEEHGGLHSLLPWRLLGRSLRLPVYGAPFLRLTWAAPPPSLALTGAHATCRALLQRTV